MALIDDLLLLCITCIRALTLVNKDAFEMHLTVNSLIFIRINFQAIW